MENEDVIGVDPLNGSKKLSFEDVYYTLYRPIFFFTKQFIQEESEVQDIVADTFVKYYTQHKGFSQLHQIKSFLFTTARNAALNVLRHQKLKTSKGHDILMELQQQSTNRHFYDKLVLTEMMLIISQEVQNLPKKQRDVFTSTFFEDKTVDEIAQELDISVEAVYNNKKRAIEKLRIILKNKDIRLYLSFVKLFIG